MRSTPWVAGLLVGLLVAGSAPIDATHLGPCPAPEDQRDDGEEATVLMGPEAATVGFVPECVKIQSGGSVDFLHADVAAHPLETTLDPACFSEGTGPGDVATLTLAYEDGTLLVDGDPCPDAASETTPEHALVPVRCVIHPNMQGEITVQAAG